MAKIIPEIDPTQIDNNGEKLFYQAARELPDSYTVLYSWRYPEYREEEHDPAIREADFVIVHPEHGYMVVEVKQGDICYSKGMWQEYKHGSYLPLHKDPVRQAETAMYAILDQYKKKKNVEVFPLKIKYAVAFPECSQIKGELPPVINRDCVFLFADVEKLDSTLLRAFGGKKQRSGEADYLVQHVLAPSFNVFSRLEDKINEFHRQQERILTEEQERIIEETELDKRKIFLGSAGTGKTFIAMEKAQRLAAEGKKVLLTCFNKSLSRQFAELMAIGVVGKSFHEYTTACLTDLGREVIVPEDKDEKRIFFDEDLPNMAFEHFCDRCEEEKFDSIIVDEGQDFRPDWFDVLEAVLKKDGEFYIFADPNQNLFGIDMEALEKFDVSRQRLTVNLRNTEMINDWVCRYSDGKKPAVRYRGGLPVNELCVRKSDAKRLIGKEIRSLISQGLSPGHVYILGPHNLPHSSLAGIDAFDEWPLQDFRKYEGKGIRYATIRSFKGMEADIVFLVDCDERDELCTRADIYVAGSRARFLLNVINFSD